MDQILLFVIHCGGTVLTFVVFGAYLLLSIGPLCSIGECRWNAIWAIPYSIFMLAMLLFIGFGNSPCAPNGLIPWVLEQIWGTR